MEEITLENGIVQLHVVAITGDGNCLFRAIAHIVYGRQSDHEVVRQLIVEHVCRNWVEFQVLSCTRGEDNYESDFKYREEMGLCGTYVTLCEIIAVAQIFPFVFEVWRNSNLYYKTASHGRTDLPSKRLLFTGRLSEGHFDVLQEVETLFEEVLEDNVLQSVRKKCRKRKIITIRGKKVKQMEAKKCRTQEQIDARKETDYIRKSHAREKEDEETKRKRLMDDRVRHAKAKTKEADTIRKRNNRMNEDQAAKRKRLECDTNRHNK